MKLRKIFILLIIISTTPFICFAQKKSIIKLLNKGEYSQVYEKIQTSFKDTNDVERLELLSLYYSQENNPEKNACLAYYYGKRLNNKEEREVINLEDICKQELTRVYNSKDIEQLENYVHCFKEEKKYAKEAERILEQVAFEKTQMLNTLEDYENYIRRFPDAIQVNLARQAIDEIISLDILESGDLGKLEDFVQKTKNEKYKQQALQEIERIIFQNTLEENTKEKYESYIKRFPNGVYVKLANEKLNDVIYNEVVASSSLSSMISFVKNNPHHPKLDCIIQNLQEKSLQQLSIEGLKTVLELQYDTAIVNIFIKNYLADPTKANIAIIEEAFPDFKQTKTVLTAKKLNEDYNFLLRKSSINNNDLKNHRGLFFKKNNSLTKRLLEKYLAQQKNSKRTDNRISGDLIRNFQQSSKVSFNLIDKEFDENDIVSSSNVVFSAHTPNGYLPESSIKNEDIYIIKTNELGKQDTILLPSSINTRFNETSPVLSSDGKTLFFSSNAGVNHGGMDIYISHREDTNIVDNWSMPMLLGKKLNSEKDDYVLSLNKYKIVVANANGANKRSYLMDSDLEFTSAYVLDKKGNFLQQDVIILDAEKLDTIAVVQSNEKGYVSFLKPNKPYYLIAQKWGYLGFFSQDNSQIVVQKIDDLFETKQFCLLESPFNEKKLTELTPKGKKEIEYLANSIKNQNYITTISLHVHSVNKTEKAQEISDKQAQVITDLLVKNGVNKDNIIVASYANTSPLIGWEGKNRIEIGFLLEK